VAWQSEEQAITNRYTAKTLLPSVII